MFHRTLPNVILYQCFITLITRSTSMSYGTVELNNRGLDLKNLTGYLRKARNLLNIKLLLASNNNR